jgi:hypothetical protein
MVQGRPYNNACLSITSELTGDPFFVYANGKIYLTFTANSRIPLWEARSLLNFWREAEKGEENGYRKGPVWYVSLRAVSLLGTTGPRPNRTSLVAQIDQADKQET